MSFDTEGSGADGEQGQSALLYYVGIFRRRFWIIMPVVLIFGAIGLIRAFRATPVYLAQAKVIVERTAPQIMQFQEGLDDRYRWDPDFYATQTELVRSRAVMEIALEQPTMRDLFAHRPTGEGPRSSLRSEIRKTLLSLLGASPTAPPEPWEILQSQIGAAHVPDTHFMLVKVYHTIPHRAAQLANAAAAAYQEYHRRQKMDMLGEAFMMLEKEKEKAEKDLQAAERELHDFSVQAKGVAVTEKEQPAISKLIALNERLTAVEIRRLELASQIAVMREATGTEGERKHISDDRLFAMAVIKNDASLTALRSSITDTEKDVASLARVYGAEHPLLRAARSRAEMLRGQFRTTLGEVLGAMENQLSVIVGEEAGLREQYDSQKREALELAKESFTRTGLENAVNRYRQLYDALVERMREIDITQGLVKTTVQIVEKAPIPTSPVGAGKMRTVLVALCMGLFLGIGLAFLFENLDDTIKTPEDLKEHSVLPLLGFVPAVRQDEATKEEYRRPEQPLWERIKASAGQRLALLLPDVLPMVTLRREEASDARRAYTGSITLTEPLSSVAEAYRSLRANLFYSTPAEEVRVLSVTSCRPQEGKTTTCCNLALSIAQIGKRVLLIDGDLHRPAVHRTLAMTNATGLSSVLVGEVSWRQAVRKIDIGGKTVDTLEVMTAGPSSPTPSELLGSSRMKELLGELRKAYDWVIVDTPPVLFVSDAGILSVMSDGAIVVVHAGTSTRALLNRTCEQLKNLRVRTLGVILNNVLVSRMGRHYSSYYNYGYSRYAKD